MLSLHDRRFAAGALKAGLLTSGQISTCRKALRRLNRREGGAFSLATVAVARGLVPCDAAAALIRDINRERPGKHPPLLPDGSPAEPESGMPPMPAQSRKRGPRSFGARGSRPAKPVLIAAGVAALVLLLTLAYGARVPSRAAPSKGDADVTNAPQALGSNERRGVPVRGSDSRTKARSAEK